MNNKQNKRSVFYVSDRTGKPAESLGQSLLSQFDGIEFSDRTFAFVITEMEAHFVAGQIQREYEASGVQPIVFSTLVNDEIQQFISATDACVISLFNAFIAFSRFMVKVTIPLTFFAKIFSYFMFDFFSRS